MRRTNHHKKMHLDRAERKMAFWRKVRLELLGQVRVFNVHIQSKML